MNALLGVHLTASFWGMFAFGRFMSIGLATRVSAVTILLVNSVRIFECGVVASCGCTYAHVYNAS